jgi:hypothetical protein
MDGSSIDRSVKFKKLLDDLAVNGPPVAGQIASCAQHTRFRAG